MKKYNNFRDHEIKTICEQTEIIPQQKCIETIVNEEWKRSAILCNYLSLAQITCHVGFYDVYL